MSMAGADLTHVRWEVVFVDAPLSSHAELAEARDALALVLSVVPESCQDDYGIRRVETRYQWLT